MKFFKKYTCSECERKFSKQEELMQHDQTVHCKDLPYYCEKCKESYFSMEEMRTHLQRKHTYTKGN